MQMIAGAAAVTKPTLYQRYVDKEALLRAVVHSRVETWSRSAADREAPRGDTLDQRLRYYGRSMLHWTRQPEILAFRELIRECHGSAPEVAREVDAIRLSRMLDQIASDIAEYGARDGLVAGNPRRLATLFYGMVSAMPALADGDPTYPEMVAEHVDQIVDILMAGAVAWTVPT